MKLVSILNLKLISLGYVPDQDEISQYFPLLLPDGYMATETPMVGLDGAAEHGGSRWAIIAWYEILNPNGEKIIIEYNLEGNGDKIEHAFFTPP